jgi:hypothetical protein
MVNIFFHNSFFPPHVIFEFIILKKKMFRIFSLLQNIIVDFVVYVLSMMESHEMNVVLVHIHIINNVMYFLYLMSLTSWGSVSLCLIKFFLNCV